MQEQDKRKIRERLGNWDYLNSISRRELKKQFRLIDESDLYPICGRFNATERAIRRVDNYQRIGGSMSNFEYAECLEREISTIVNSL